MNKKIITIILLFITIVSLALVLFRPNVQAGTDVTAEEIKGLFKGFYADGYYTKDSVINIDSKKVEEEYKSYFHAEITTLVRTTIYKDTELWMNSGEGTSYIGFGTNDGKLTQFVVSPDGLKGNETVSSELPAMEDYYCTLNDFAVGSHTSKHSNDIKLDLTAGWTVDGGVYTSTNKDVINGYRLFTAPGLLAKTEENANYFDFTQVTAEVVENQLIMKLWVSSTDAVGKLNDNANAVGENVVFSQATILRDHILVNSLDLNGNILKTTPVDVVYGDDLMKINAPENTGYVASHDYIKLDTKRDSYDINIYYSEVDVWDGNSVSESLSGSGSEADPYLIQSGADLAYVAKVVNDAAAKTANFKGMYFKMTKSIDLNGKELKIGGYTAGKEFHGYFDGNNCTVRGINATQSLFGMLKNGYIKNLSTYGTVVTTEKKGVAGLVSYMSGATVENITNYVDVTGVQQAAGVVGWLENNTTTIAKNCVNYGNIYATSYQIGGIAGFAKGSLTDCTNYGDVESTNSYVGGIGGAAKDATGSRSNCVNYGNISAKSYIGGCFGQITATTTNCYSFGTAKIISGTATTVGDVVGSGANYLKYN